MRNLHTSNPELPAGCDPVHVIRSAEVRPLVSGSTIVIGADGQIGAGLVSFLARNGASVDGTTRRKERVGTGRPFLDLEGGQSTDGTEGNFAYAFFCAGITAISACESEPTRSRLVNVTNSLRLLRRLYAAGTRIVFLSSNSVFNGNTVRPDEGADYCASTEYGRQKEAVERELLGWRDGAGSIAVARLSKVLSPTSGLAGEFIEKLCSGKQCAAFNDLSMSPVSLAYVVESLVKVAASGVTGIFHISGAEEMTYAEFARRLAKRLGVDSALVRECRVADAGMEVLFRPVHPALGMRRTSEALGIEPETATHLMDMLMRQKV